MKSFIGKRITRAGIMTVFGLALVLLLGGCAAKEAVGNSKLQDIASSFGRTSNINRYDNYDENGNVSGYWVDEYTLEGKHISKKLYSEDDVLLREERFSQPDKTINRTEVYDGEGVLTEIRDEILDLENNPNPNQPSELRVYNAENEMIQFEQYQYVEVNSIDTWVVTSYSEKLYEDGIKDVYRSEFNGEYPVTVWHGVYENDVLITEYFYDENGTIETIRRYSEDGTYSDETP